MHKKKSRLKEYSKKAIAAMIILWFVIAIFGMVVVIYQLSHSYSPEMVSLDSLYSYVGVPMTGGIVMYLIKSAMENKQKIKKSNNFDTQEEQITIQNFTEKG